MIQAVDNFFKSAFMTSFGTALLRSLWEGLVIMLFTFAGLAILRMASARVRHNFLGLMMMLFILSFLFTFCIGLTTALHSTNSVDGGLGSHIQQISSSPLIPYGISSLSFFRSTLNFMSGHTDLFLMIWFSVFVFQGLRIIFLLSYASRLVKHRSHAIPACLQNQITHLARKIGVKKMVSAVGSTVAKIPVVFGHFRPVILLPLGMVTKLSPEQLEAVLIHELGHIRRNDFLTNSCLQFIKAVFFFNPFCHWLIALMRQEREHACDDLVVAQTGKKKELVSALLFFRGHGYPLNIIGTPFLAGNAFLDRVGHIVLGKNRTIRAAETFGMMFLLFLGIFAWLAIYAGPRSAPARSKVSPMVNAIRSHAPRAMEIPPTRGPVSLNTQLPKKTQQDTSQPKTNFIAADLQREIGQQLYRDDLIADTGHMNITLNERELIVNGVRMSGQVHERIFAQFGDRHNYGGSVAPIYENRHPGPYDDFLTKRSEEIAAELIREDMVHDRTHFSYRLSNAELIIDGIKRSEELHRRFVDEFFKPDDRFDINYNFRDPGHINLEDHDKGTF